MAKKIDPINNNVNNNTNNVNVNVHVPRSKKATAKKKEQPNWYTRTIVGGAIALILSLCGYLVKKNMDDKSNGNSNGIEQNAIPIEGEKQN